MEMTAAVRRLVTYRLEEDLSYSELAARMSEHGCSMPMRTLYYILKSRLVTKGRDRTLYKIAKFIRLMDAQTTNGHKPVHVPAPVRAAARRKTARTRTR